MIRRRATGIAVLAALVGAACVPTAPRDPGALDPSDPPPLTGGPAALVNPFVGTAPAQSSSPVPGGTMGDTFPGASVPFGAIQWSPDTPGAENPAGYAWSDTTIDGFSLTHFSGAGCPNGGLVRFLPGTDGRAEAPLAFAHSNEAARPGSYEVTSDDGIGVQLASATRSAIGRFTFPAGGTPTIRIDNAVRARAIPALDVPGITVLDDRTIVGQAVGGGFCGTPTQHRMWFVVEFNRPFEVASAAQTDQITVTFAADGHPVIARTAVSFVDLDGARVNLAAEIDTWSWGEVRNAAYQRWNDLLGRLTVTGGTEVRRRTFTTALYHSLLHPNVSSDVDGRYLGFDGWVHLAEPGHVHLANLSGWDIYRSQVQLLAVVVPEVARDLSESMLADAQQCGGGFPKWSVMNTETSVMLGDPGAQIMANLDAFGAGTADAPAVLDVLRRSAEDPSVQCSWQRLRPGLARYLSDGYVPSLPESEADTPLGRILTYLLDLGDTSVTLEYASADAAIGAYATRHGDLAFAARELARGRSWINHFDPASGYVRPRLVDGSFAADFDPSALYGFVEGNAAQYTWMVPQDIGGVVAALGGADAARARLDDLFAEVNSGITEPHFYIGNEPQFTVPWAYLWAESPAGTQLAVRRIIDAAFGDGPAGLPGNDDLGATSSWLVWASIGLFPVLPGRDVLGLHTPLFPRVDLVVPGRPAVHITAPGAPDAAFVQGATLGGAAREQPWLGFDELLAAGDLAFSTRTTAGSWGSAPGLQPPSLSD